MANPFHSALRRTISADAMRRAHEAARHAVELSGGTLNYREALKPEISAARRGEGLACPPDTLFAQTVAWADHCRACGVRFNVEKKANESLAFTLAEDLMGLNIPSKLWGVAKNQGNVALLEVQLELYDGPRLLRAHPLIDGVEIYNGGDLLGRVLPKHLRWLGPLPRVRYAAICVTGGTADRPLSGVNIAIEVWPVLTLPAAAVLDAAMDVAAEDESDGRHIYGEVPLPRAAEPDPTVDHWKAIGGWEQ